MTVDLRQPSPNRETAPRPASLDANRRAVVLILYASAMGFFMAGVWLLLGEQSFFDAEIAPLAGMAFIIAAFADVVAVAVLKRLWAGASRR
jgi:hypothetical protein